ncbi:MAG TPA: hypothetical protein VIV61_16755 [Candidatus Ozemobacteraceae bacterium]
MDCAIVAPPANFPHRAGRGVALLALTVALLLSGIALALWLPRANLEVKRAKEEELRFVLGEFRRAAEKFTRRNGRPPVSLEEMCRDGQGRRFLRRIYEDPITGRPDWNVQVSSVGIIVSSSSPETSAGGVPYSRFR